MGGLFDRDGAESRRGVGGDEPRGALGRGDGRDPHPWHGVGHDGDHGGKDSGGGHAAEARRPGFDLDLVRVLPREDALLWTWRYSGEGIFAHGALKTTDTADADGFYLITAIAGERNGERIIGLQPAGTAIPGNEPFAVDNLIGAEGPQLTGGGLGYAPEDGTYANPFFADFRSPETYLEFFSAPPFGPEPGLEDSELPVGFVGRVPPPPRPAYRGEGGHRHHHQDHDGQDDCHGRSEAYHTADAWLV
jgi:hypothetical protein